MKRTLVAALFLSIAASTSAFAGDIGSNAPKTRAEVKAEVVQAWRDGTLPSLNKTSYPEQGLVGRTQAKRVAIQHDAHDDATRVASEGQ